ncbi:MAG: ornithine cyclodeaminase family protein [Bryobacteraceae bacterium]|nr:ornithine cyclodeaminase family protein [Bryobacteraceae bacterium]
MLTITEADVRRLLPMEDAIEALRGAFAAWRAGEAQNQPRRRMVLPEGACLHQLAGAYRGYFGTKVYATHPKHGAWFHVLLYDAATAKPLAFFEADWLGQIRTGAATGLATDLLAPAGASVVGLIGSGYQAAGQLAAVRAVRKLTEVRVWSRNAANAAKFAGEHDCIATATAEEAIRGAGIVITATSAREPVLESDWVRPNAHVNAVGSNQAQKRELPSALIARASLIAVDSLPQAQLESGDLLLSGLDWSDPRLVELKDVGPRQPGLSIFKSNGLGLEDVAVAALVYERMR